jgi:hypothetical protein
VTYRVHPTQSTLIYRDDAYIGVMFTAEDATLVVEALNDREAEDGREVDRANAMFDEWADVRRRIVNRAEHRPSSHQHGLGYGPCVGCGELWPCQQSRRERPVPASTCLGCNVARRNPGSTCPHHGAVL